MPLRLLHDALLRLLYVERRFDPFFRPYFDALLREPLAGLTQALIRFAHPSQRRSATGRRRASARRRGVPGVDRRGHGRLHAGALPAW